MTEKYQRLKLSGDYEKDIETARNFGLPKKPDYDKDSAPLDEYNSLLDYDDIVQKHFGETKPNKYEK